MIRIPSLHNRGTGTDARVRANTLAADDSGRFTS